MSVERDDGWGWDRVGEAPALRSYQAIGYLCGAPSPFSQAARLGDERVVASFSDCLLLTWLAFQQCSFNPWVGTSDIPHIRYLRYNS